MYFQDNSIEIKQMKLYTSILKELIAATHCHSCNYKMNVSLLGYSGRYCDKYCWKGFIRNSNNNCINDNCIYCDNNINYSLARSKYHSVWRKIQSNNGLYWPMCSENKLCNNECIKYNQTIHIPGYNY